MDASIMCQTLFLTFLSMSSGLKYHLFSFHSSLVLIFILVLVLSMIIQNVFVIVFVVVDKKDAQNNGLSNHKLKSALKCTI